MNASKETLLSFTSDELFYLRVSLLHYSIYLLEHDMPIMREDVKSLYERLNSISNS